MRRTQRPAIGWHVIARGARRLELFKDPEDFSTFLTILKASLTVAGATLWAFALMSNHYHLVIYASTEQLTDCMWRANRTYSRYHNRKYGLVGHAFDGPYKAYAQPTPILLLRTIAYVLMNPVSAGIRERPQDWIWSSARDYLGLPGSPLTVYPSMALERVSQDPAQAWSAFHRAMQREASRPRRPLTDQLSRTQVHAQQFEWLLEHATEIEAMLGGEDLTTVAMYWGRMCGIVPRAMALVLGDRSARQISRTISDFAARLRGGSANPSIAALP